MLVPADVHFLDKLYKKLKYISFDERIDVIENYKTIIYEKYQTSGDMNKVISELETPESISENIYKELETNIPQIRSKSRVTFLKILVAFMTLILFMIIIPFDLVFLGMAIGTFPTTIYAIVMTSIIYEPWTAAGFSVLLIGLGLIIGCLMVWLTAKTWEFIRLIVNGNISLYSFKKFPFKRFKLFKSSKIFYIVGSVFMSILIAGLVGTTATNNTMFGSQIMDEYVNELTFKIDNVDKPINIDKQYLDGPFIIKTNDKVKDIHGMNIKVKSNLKRVILNKITYKWKDSNTIELHLSYWYLNYASFTPSPIEIEYI